MIKHFNEQFMLEQHDIMLLGTGTIYKPRIHALIDHSEQFAHKDYDLAKIHPKAIVSPYDIAHTISQEGLFNPFMKGTK